MVVKIYPEGKVCNYLAELPLGSPVEFKHIPFNVKIQYPYQKKHVAMICGGNAPDSPNVALCCLGSSI